MPHLFPSFLHLSAPPHLHCLLSSSSVLLLSQVYASSHSVIVLSFPHTDLITPTASLLTDANDSMFLISSPVLPPNSLTLIACSQPPHQTSLKCSRTKLASHTSPARGHRGTFQHLLLWHHHAPNHLSLGGRHPGPASSFPMSPVSGLVMFTSCIFHNSFTFLCSSSWQLAVLSWPLA
jgi:hypothetical protein